MPQEKPKSQIKQSILEHENGLINSFIKKEKRDRYRAFLKNTKKRLKFLDRLNHELINDIISER